MKISVLLTVMAVILGVPAFGAGYNDYIDAAKDGDAKAMFELGFCYLKGDGVEQSEKEALVWFNKAAEKNYGHAECVIGLFYAFGRGGLPQNDKEALKYFNKAAEKDIPEAYFNIGKFYAVGRGGLPPNEEKAKEWYLKAAAKDHAAAKTAWEKLNQPKETQDNRFGL